MYPRQNTDGGYVDNGSPSTPGTGTGGGGTVPPTQPPGTGGQVDNKPAVDGLTITKLTAKVLYRVTNHDNIAISGYIKGLPADLKTAGLSMSVNIAGATQQIVLDARGSGRTKTGALKFGAASKDGVRTFRALMKGSLAGNWSDDGISSAAPSGNVDIPVEMTVKGTVYKTSVPASYTNVKGKAGKLKN